MNQTKMGSLIESIINVFVGYVVALTSQLIIFPFFDIHVSLETNFYIGFWFTLVSLLRSYCIRRWFNARISAASRSMAGVISND